MKKAEASQRRHSFAYRHFFEIADHDYLAARVLYRSGCLDQFLIATQQCIEKYLKAILLFHDMEHPMHPKPCHDLPALLQAVERIPYLSLSEDTREFIRDLNQIEGIRYLTDSFGARREDLFRLDKAVFELRIYCSSRQDLNQKFATAPLEELRKGNTRRFFINRGFLGKVIDKRDDNKYRERYRGLIWKNPWFGRRLKHRMRYTGGFWAKNTDLDDSYHVGGCGWDALTTLGFSRSH